MGYNRSRKENSQYNAYIKIRKNSDYSICEFCEIHEKSSQFVKKTEYFKVIRNIFPYSIWDSRRVTDHLMLVPNEHTETLSTLSSSALQEYTILIAEYESAGYNIYARTPSSTMKSVPHQHTHLIKANGKRVKMLLHLDKPYLRFII